MSHAILQKTILNQNADVLVLGAGLAGIMAAISAAEAGAKVCLVSSGCICSGSSFYSGTWGFGLVGPEDKEDEINLAEIITSVGMDLADRSLVDIFVSEIHDSIAYLEQMGVPLKEAGNPLEREFIPCFDYKCRSWHGIVKETAKPVFLRRLQELGVTLMPHTEITELLQEKNSNKASARVTGAIAVTKTRELVVFSCKTLVIATGGIGGLYQYRLNPSDVTGMGQYLALMAGASLINIEFMQMMPGFLSPAYGTVFNEKIFRYTESHAFDGWGEDQKKELLEARSGHGPYTSRLKSHLVDEAITCGWEQDTNGVLVSYRQEGMEHPPEFVKTYFDWLKTVKNLTPEDPVRIGIFAHASNGGIQIDQHGKTGILGLYACGEATGGMHGADRLGGLSTANGLVFGRRAGKAAAIEAKRDKTELTNHTIEWLNGDSTQEPQRTNGTIELRVTRAELKHRMNRCGMIARNEEKCMEMLDWLSCMAVEWKGKSDFCDEMEYYLEFTRLKAELVVARCLMQAILLRRESRGSHHREDYPACDPALAHKIACSYREGEIISRWI